LQAVATGRKAHAPKTAATAKFIEALRSMMRQIQGSAAVPRERRRHSASPKPSWTTLRAPSRCREIPATAGVRPTCRRSYTPAISSHVRPIIQRRFGGGNTFTPFAINRRAEEQKAREALDAVERTASKGLSEMRRLLGALREEGESAALAPQPSLNQIDALVADVRGAGLPVELRVEGASRELPPGIDLCAYRIVQEALTNTLKHAGPATARVLLRYAEDEVEVEITDTGAADPNGSAPGQGLAGMRERVALFGGQFEAGPQREGGYLVTGRLPL
jgi:two-component sensor histidine kinase